MVAVFKNYYLENSHQSYVNWIIPETGQVTDWRCVIVPKSKAYIQIRNILNNHFDSSVYFWADYQRQYFPQNMHIDDYGKDRKHPTYTIVIPLVDDSRLKTIVWKDMFPSNKEWNEYVMTWKKEEHTKKNNISELVDLEHNFYKEYGEYIGEYMDIDAVFEYHVGDYVLFDTNQIHSSSTWVRYKEYEYKDLVQIHITDTTKTL
jgi:hypothetical protein